MKKKLSDDEQQFIERFRPLGNQPSLRKQLKKIFQEVDTLKNFPREKFIGQVITMRNRIEHSTSHRTEKHYYLNIGNIVHNLKSVITSIIMYEIEW